MAHGASPCVGQGSVCGLLRGVPSATRRVCAFVNMTDTGMARQALDRIGLDDAPMHELPHGIAWTGERLEGVTAATRDGVVRLQKGFDRSGQLRAAFLPVFFGTNAPRELAPHILRAAIGLEQQQAYVLRRGRVVRIIRDVAIAAGDAHSKPVVEVR